MKGLRRLRKLGRDLRPHQAQREGPHGPRISRGRKARSRGPGSARTARAASSTPPGGTTNGPGAIPASRTSSNAASAGPAATIRRVGAGLRRQARQMITASARTSSRSNTSRPRSRSIRRQQWGAGGADHARCRSRCAGRVDEAHRHPAGFELKLFAAEPQTRRQADLHDLGRTRPALGRR